MSHFFTSFIIAGVLWKTNYPKFRRFVPLFVGLTFIGYITYVLYPAMPPWMASQFGHLPHTTRIIDQVWKHLHIGLGKSLFAGGNKFDNNVAAMPSLHGAYPMLICLFFWKGSSPRKRMLLAAYPDLHGLLARLHRRALRDRHLRGVDLRRRSFYFGSKLLDRWEARRMPEEPRQGEGKQKRLEALEPDAPLITSI